MAFLTCLIGAVLGYVAPGWLLCRRWRTGATLPVAMIVSTVLLVQAAFYLQLLGAPLTRWTVGGVLILLCGVAALIGSRMGAATTDATPEPTVAPAPQRWTLAQGAVLTALIVQLGWLCVRIFVMPLLGGDTLFRWEFLGKLVFQHHNFSFYPPITDADYAIYFFTDSIPPLVQLSYFWTYASCGDYWPHATAVFVGLQVLCLGWLAYGATKLHTGSRMAGLTAAALLGSSQLLIASIATGQETCVTALSMLGVYYVLIWGEHGAAPNTPEAPSDTAATATRRHQAILLAGFAAAAGALAREYGWVMLIIAIVVALMHGYTRRQVLALIAVTVALAAPWYLRTWAITGNPVYSIDVASLFPINPVHDQLVKAQHAQNPDVLEQAKACVTLAMQNAGLLALLGAAAVLLAVRVRRFRSLLVAMALIAVIWMLSVPYTYYINYSLRVLSPVMGAAAILIVCVACRHRERSGRAWNGLAATVITAALTFGLLNVAIYPQSPTIVAPSDWPQYASLPTLSWGPNVRNPPGVDELRETLRTQHVDTRMKLLTTNAYTHALLTDDGYDVVPLWAPQVRFLYEGDHADATIDAHIQRLTALGIRLVIYAPDTVDNTTPLHDITRHSQLLYENKKLQLFLLPTPTPTPRAK
ncbi:MAG: hypothetical protein GC159_13450 [Phycisphaera sp.]|nr:hypothetical protein [Phycisphaera sp.]